MYSIADSSLSYVLCKVACCCILCTFIVPENGGCSQEKFCNLHGWSQLQQSCYSWLRINSYCWCISLGFCCNWAYIALVPSWRPFSTATSSLNCSSLGTHLHLQHMHGTVVLQMNEKTRDSVPHPETLGTHCLKKDWTHQHMIPVQWNPSFVII